MPAQPAQMAFGMFARPIARGVEQRRRRIRAAEGPVVADIDPDPAGVGLALRQDRHGRVVAMQPLGGQDMASISACSGAAPRRRRRPDRPASTG